MRCSCLIGFLFFSLFFAISEFIIIFKNGPHRSNVLFLFAGVLLSVPIIGILFDCFLNNQTPKRLIIGYLAASLSIITFLVGLIVSDYFLKVSYGILIFANYLLLCSIALFTFSYETHVERDLGNLKLAKFRIVLLYFATLPMMFYFYKCPYLGALLNFGIIYFYAQACLTNRTKTFQRFRRTKEGHWHLSKFTGDEAKMHLFVETIRSDHVLCRLLDRIDFVTSLVMENDNDN